MNAKGRVTTARGREWSASEEQSLLHMASSAWARTMSWPDIANVFGVSEAAAKQKHAKLLQRQQAVAGTEKGGTVSSMWPSHRMASATVTTLNSIRVSQHIPPLVVSATMPMMPMMPGWQTQPRDSAWVVPPLIQTHVCRPVQLQAVPIHAARQLLLQSVPVSCAVSAVTNPPVPASEPDEASSDFDEWALLAGGNDDGNDNAESVVAAEAQGESSVDVVEQSHDAERMSLEAQAESHAGTHETQACTVEQWHSDSPWGAAHPTQSTQSTSPKRDLYDVLRAAACQPGEPLQEALMLLHDAVKQDGLRITGMLSVASLFALRCLQVDSFTCAPYFDELRTNPGSQFSRKLAHLVCIQVQAHSLHQQLRREASEEEKVHLRRSHLFLTAPLWWRRAPKHVFVETLVRSTM